MSNDKPNAGPKVFVLHYQHRHGDDFGAYGRREAAEQARAALCAEYADEVYVPNATPSADELIAARVRALYAEGKFNECADLYLEHVENEHMDIHELEVTGFLPIEELIARSSLGEPDVVAARAGVDPAAVAKVMARLKELEKYGTEGRQALNALRAILPFFHPGVGRGPAIENWVAAARSLIAALPDADDTGNIQAMLKRADIPVERP